MRSFGLLLVGAAYATEEEPEVRRCWVANDNAPFCGCQFITENHNMINQTCTATFDKKTHFVSVASAFAVPELSDTSADTYVWTGFQGNSHENLHDILVFYQESECEDYKNTNKSSLMAKEAEWEPTINCVEQYGGDADPNVRLGNFVYDIARSVQSYNLPIKNLDLGQTVAVQINRQARLGFPEVSGVELKNVSAHHGHGDASAEDCANDGRFVYTQNADHGGDLEYAQFELCDTGDDYTWDVPSSWESEVIV